MAMAFLLHNPMLRGAVAASLLWAASAAAQAHGIWFAQRSGDLALIYGEGGDDLDAAKRLPLIKAVAGYDAAGRPVQTALEAAGKLALVDLREQPAIVAAVLDNGIWTKAANGQWFKKPRGEVPGASASGHNFKYAVHLRAPLGRPLEGCLAMRCRSCRSMPRCPRCAANRCACACSTAASPLPACRCWPTSSTTPMAKRC